MKKILCLVLVLVMALCACAFPALAEEPTHLVTISLGSKPNGYDAVMAAVNEYLAAEYGLSLEVRFLDWDPSKVYPIIMNTGDGVDLVFFSGWPGSQDWARKGAFLELDEMLSDYPALVEAIPADYWEAVKINGHIYSVPAPEVSWSANNGIIYRADLCEKYDLPAPDSIEHIIEYAEGILANEEGMFPMSTTIPQCMQFTRFDTLLLPGGNNDYGIVITETPDNISAYWGTDAHLEELTMCREWMEKGYFSRDLQNETLGESGLFENGFAAMMANHHTDSLGGRVQTLESAIETNPEKADWKISFVPFNVNFGKVQISSPANLNATGISYVYSEHAKESLTLLQAIYTDAKLHHLLRYGVEGVHYEIDEDGFYKNISSDFTACGLSLWNWRSDALNLEGANTKAALAKEEVFEIYRSCERMFSNFVFNKANVENEIANLTAVRDQYLKPLQYGLIDDVEAGLATFMEKANEAGLEKIQEEYINQYNEWYASENG